MVTCYLRNEIKKAGAKYGVDAQIIASIKLLKKKCMVFGLIGKIFYLFTLI